MRQLLFICVILPNFCFAGVDARMLYIKAVEDFSTCGNALMPWGGNGWRPDEVEKPYVLQAKINRAKMQTEIDAGFYTCLLYTSPSPRDRQKSRMPSSA